MRQLRHFLAVAAAGSITEASARLHVAQPALSSQLRSLEDELGVQLLVRQPRGIALTDGGRELRDLADRVLEDYDALIERAKELAQGRRGAIRVGFMAHAAAELTPHILRTFREQNPGVSVQLRQFGFDDSLVGLGRDLVDVAFVIGPPDEDDRIELLKLFDDPVVALMASDHPLASRSEIAIGEVVNEPFFADPHPPGRWTDFWLAMKYRSSPRVEIAGECASHDELLEAISMGGGLTLCPSSTERFYARPGLAFVPVSGMEPALNGVAWRTDRCTPLVRSFVEAALAVATNQADELRSLVG